MNKSPSYQLVSRAYRENRTSINVGGIQIGAGEFVVIAGPCSVESKEQLLLCAEEAKRCGAKVLRGGCFKPRTSPYSFQGLGFQALSYLHEVGKFHSIPVITEVLDAREVSEVSRQVDVVQVGARNMQNTALLKAVGAIDKPVLLKRGMMSSIEELLCAAEYIVTQGNEQVILCERGIRTFETTTRYTLDLSAVPVLKELTHLPIIVDPSHAAGRRSLVPALSCAAKAVGADGLIIEMHPQPDLALSDGAQSLDFMEFERLMLELR